MVRKKYDRKQASFVEVPDRWEIHQAFIDQLGYSPSLSGDDIPVPVYDTDELPADVSENDIKQTYKDVTGL
jgi:hypothetical protein